MKKVICVILCVVFMLLTMSLLTACNMGLYDLNLKIGYVVLQENGHSVLHKVEKWYDTDSDSSAFKLACCGNYVWTSANLAIAYTEKPADYAYDFECGVKSK